MKNLILSGFILFLFFVMIIKNDHTKDHQNGNSSKNNQGSSASRTDVDIQSPCFSPEGVNNQLGIGNDGSP